MVWILRSAPLLLPRPRSACTWAALISQNWMQLICLIAIVSWTLLQRLHKTEPNLQTLLQRLPARCSAATSFFAQRSMVCLYNALFNDISITDARWFALVATHALWCGASGLWNNMWANPPPLFEQHPFESIGHFYSILWKNVSKSPTYLFKWHALSLETKALPFWPLWLFPFPWPSWPQLPSFAASSVSFVPSSISVPAKDWRMHTQENKAELKNMAWLHQSLVLELFSCHWQLCPELLGGLCHWGLIDLDCNCILASRLMWLCSDSLTRTW